MSASLPSCILETSQIILLSSQPPSCLALAASVVALGHLSLVTALVFRTPCCNLFGSLANRIPDLWITAVTTQRIYVSLELVMVTLLGSGDSDLREGDSEYHSSEGRHNFSQDSPSKSESDIPRAGLLPAHAHAMI